MAFKNHYSSKKQFYPIGISASFDPRIALLLYSKDKMLHENDQEISKSNQCRFIYDLIILVSSFFRRFPNISASVGRFSHCRNAPFEGDTLLALNGLSEIELNLKSGFYLTSYPTLQGFNTEWGNLYVKVLRRWRAN